MIAGSPSPKGRRRFGRSAHRHPDTSGRSLPPAHAGVPPAGSAGRSGSNGKNADVYYKTCSAARAAGAAPIRQGEPGYRHALDRDDDGVACERD
ncbi:excalibur calcium-binding domain-containing protein [Streptomyces sp. NPDC056401]|uniref:excalibur calcium-binding domain-containing protein n=1 Tax=Streptomyces sp. NPDC056401 TaxID=3345809 RepID=UPI0035DDB619